MKEKIKQTILELLKKNSDYSFSELISDLENIDIQAKGDRVLYLKENLIIWENCTTDFNNAIIELINADKITLHPLSQSKAELVYAFGGVIPDIPVADRIEKYVSPHWMPTIIKLK